MKILDIDKIYNMDVMDFLNSIENNSIDLAIVDPPYNMKKADWDCFKTSEEYFDFTFAWLDLMLNKMKKHSSFYFFNSPFNSAMILAYIQKKNLAQYRNWITWYKKDGFSSTKKRYVNNQETILFYTMSNEFTFNADDIRIPYLSVERLQAAVNKGILKNGKRWYPNPKGKLCPDVWEIVSQRHIEKENGKVVRPIHPTIKPKEMIERMIKASSNKGDLVLDLFSGTGTTSVVSKELGRHFIGCESDPTYHKIISERLKKSK